MQNGNARGTRKRRGSAIELHWQIPIVDRRRRIVAWTVKSPETVGPNLRHEEAEGILHGPISAAYLELSDHELAVRAGAPPTWPGKWRCLAIVNDDSGAADVIPAESGGASPRNGR